MTPTSISTKLRQMQSIHPPAELQNQTKYKFIRFFSKNTKDKVLSKSHIIKNFSLDITNRKTIKYLKTLKKSKAPIHLTLSLTKPLFYSKIPGYIFFHSKYLQNLSSLNLRLLNEESLSYSNRKLPSLILSRLNPLTRTGEFFLHLTRKICDKIFLFFCLFVMKVLQTSKDISKSFWAHENFSSKKEKLDNFFPIKMIFSSFNKRRKIYFSFFL